MKLITIIYTYKINYFLLYRKERETEFALLECKHLLFLNNFNLSTFKHVLYLAIVISELTNK